MENSVKKNKGTLLGIIILALIPLIIINCYSFYVTFADGGIDYSSLNKVDFNAILSGDADSLLKLETAFSEITVDGSEDYTVKDAVLDGLGILIAYFLQIYVIVMSVNRYFGVSSEKISNVKVAVKRMLPAVLLSALAGWINYEISSLFLTAMIHVSAGIYVKNIIITTSFFGAFVVLVPASTLLLMWIGSYLKNMIIAVVAGRCGTLISFAYVKEMLKGRVWKQMFRLLPYILLSSILPMILQALAIILCKWMYVALALVVLSVALEIFFVAKMWAALVPEFFEKEKTCGIQEKIRKMMDEAIAMRNGERDFGKKNEEKDEEKDEEKKDDEHTEFKE